MDEFRLNDEQQTRGRHPEAAVLLQDTRTSRLIIAHGDCSLDLVDNVKFVANNAESKLPLRSAHGNLVQLAEPFRSNGSSALHQPASLRPQSPDAAPNLTEASIFDS
jgi:hypothetical protein